MLSYTPSYTITNEMINLVSSISEKTERISIFQDYTAAHIKRKHMIKSIHSSLKMQNSPLSFFDISDLIEEKMILGSKKEIKEAKNLCESYKQLKTTDVYNGEDLKKIHKIMMQDLSYEVGVFRDEKDEDFSKDKFMFIAAPSHMVAKLMQDLFSWINANKDIIHPLILSSIVHYELIFIHPFYDANEKIARLWHKIFLYKWKNIFKYISLEFQIEKFNEEYRNSLSKSNINGNTRDFIEFMLKITDKALSDFADDIKTAEKNEYINKILDLMQDGIYYTAKDIMEKLNLKSKENFRKNYLLPAINQGYVVMSFPNKPKSKNQRYMKNNIYSN